MAYAEVCAGAAGSLEGRYMKPRRPNKTGRSATPEHFTKMLRKTMEEPAWRALSLAAQAIYPWVKFEWRGAQANNNGKLRLSVRQAAQRVGIANNTAAEGFRDLQRKGFLVQTEHACLGVEGEARAPAYEVTELAMPGNETHEGRKLYREWTPGNDFPVPSASANNPLGFNGETKTRLKNEDRTVSEFKTKKARPVSELRRPVSKMKTNKPETGPVSSQKLRHP
ncbi:hypothetical protein [Terrihabitans sp. B22-R8]|uniref:hypothetical protein n=1 Tax=Terrihabitans sp. B22-R8 TaxID=3425128 RepID=UPI00403D1D4E